MAGWKNVLGSDVTASVLVGASLGADADDEACDEEDGRETE